MYVKVVQQCLVYMPETVLVDYLLSQCARVKRPLPSRVAYFIGASPILPGLVWRLDTRARGKTRWSFSMRDAA